MFAEITSKFILKHRRDVLKAAKAVAVYKGKGRVKSVPEGEIRLCRAAGEGPAAVARQLGISWTSVYRALGSKADG